MHCKLKFELKKKKKSFNSSWIYYVEIIDMIYQVQINYVNTLNTIELGQIKPFIIVD